MKTPDPPKAAPKAPLTLLQEFLEREKLQIILSTESVPVGDGSMMVRPRFDIRPRVN